MNEIDFILHFGENTILFSPNLDGRNYHQWWYCLCGCYYWTSINHVLVRALEIMHQKGFTREHIHQSEKQL